MSKATEQSNKGPGSTGRILGSVERVKTGLKRKMETKSIETKYKAIITVEKGDRSKSDIARQFGIPASTLSTWLKTAERIKSAYSNDGTSPARKKISAEKHDDPETALPKRFANTRDQNLPIPGPMLKTKANELEETLTSKAKQRDDDDNDNADDSVSTSRPTPDMATDACDILVRYLEAQPNKTRDINVILVIADEIMRKELVERTRNRRQPTTVDYFQDRSVID